MTRRASLSIKAGDTVAKPLTVTDDAGAAINLTGATLTLHVRVPGGTVDVLSQALALTTPLSGIATLNLTAAQTAALTPLSSYRYEVECVDAGGAVTTPIEGILFVRQDFG